eukprot:CAMPEP_0171457076 /NCGR_PEP_ID=MMETSP0945-20130129/3300_1 /TAXON_ID=109269 /ORGANISM="Vaucheria litorea, Strain CCMP2940" /LENGTH=146 /DNA_ID=CAMNT_0011982613 /DNA_START=142 /DNA_END=579 /DNA_ORIENTATION=-
MAKKADKKTLDSFRKQIDEMLLKESYTLVDYRKQIEEGLNSWTAKIPLLKNRSEINQLRDSKAIIDSFTDEERADPSLITDTAMKRAAVSSKLPESDVKSLLFTYEQAKMIQKWLRKRKERGQKIPKNSSELQDLMTDNRGVGIAR